MKKVIRSIAIILIILIGMTAGYLGMSRLRGQKVPAFVDKIPVVGTYLGNPEDKTQLSPLEKENQRLNDQLTTKELQIKTYQDRVKALQLAMKALQTENDRLKLQAKKTQSLQQQEAGQLDMEDKYKDLAKYFAPMKAKDAAKIMQQKQMDDDTIIGVLQYMDKDAAAKILALLDPSKAATISKKMLQ